MQLLLDRVKYIEELVSLALSWKEVATLFNLMGYSHFVYTLGHQTQSIYYCFDNFGLYSQDTERFYS